MQEKILAGLQAVRETDDPAAMEFAAKRSVEMMQAYCNREELPEKLEGVGVALAGVLLDSGVTAAPSAKAKSIREGDISVTFAEGAETEETLLAYFRTELDRYRRMDW